jgi:protein SCO1/2
MPAGALEHASCTFFATIVPSESEKRLACLRREYFCAIFAAAGAPHLRCARDGCRHGRFTAVFIEKRMPLRLPARAPSREPRALGPALPPSATRIARRCAIRVAAVLASAALGAGCSQNEPPWQLTNVTGHLPDLKFSLTGDDGKPIDASAFKGETTLVYFGYTHCPDVCPETMARLMQVLAKVGDKDARHVRILFISVDPARDTPQALRDYVGAFDAQHARGLTGTDREIESLAKRYRVAYQMEKRDPNGSYEVTHSSAVYVFDAAGRARLIATSGDSPDAIAHDLRRIIDTAS